MRVDCDGYYRTTVAGGDFFLTPARKIYCGVVNTLPHRMLVKNGSGLYVFASKL